MYYSTTLPLSGFAELSTFQPCLDGFHPAPFLVLRQGPWPGPGRPPCSVVSSLCAAFGVLLRWQTDHWDPVLLLLPLQPLQPTTARAVTPKPHSSLTLLYQTKHRSQIIATSRLETYLRFYDMPIECSVSLRPSKARRQEIKLYDSSFTPVLLAVLRPSLHRATNCYQTK